MIKVTNKSWCLCLDVIEFIFVCHFLVNDKVVFVMHNVLLQK